MKKPASLISAFLLLFSLIVYSQPNQKADSVILFEKAKYLKADLTKYLSETVQYPEQALLKNKYGDVVLSMIIDKTGKIDSVAIVKSPDFLFSTSAIVAINSLADQWSPTKINGKAVNKEYNIAFRYRIYKDIQPPDYKSAALRSHKKQKYEKALDLLDKAIYENQYDYELFELRSRIKETLGDHEGAVKDLKTSDELKDKILSVVDVIMTGITRTRIEGTQVIRTEIRTVEVP